VTYGQPTGDGTEARKPNRNRVHWVTSTCALLTDPYGCVDSIFTQADQRFAPGSPQLPQIWFLFSGETTGECHDIARFCEAASQMLGLPGDLEVRWGYPDTDRQCFEGDTHSLNRRRRLDVSGHPPPEETTHDEICHPSDVDGAREWLIYEDASPLHLPNFHEGCFRYTHDQGTRYYAPGAGAYSSIGDVMNAVVWRTAWIYWTGPNFAAPCKDPGPYPEAVW